MAVWIRQCFQIAAEGGFHEAEYPFCYICYTVALSELLADLHDTIQLQPFDLAGLQVQIQDPCAQMGQIR